MKVCFVVPPPKTKDRTPERVYGCTFTYYRQPELPILYAAAVLENDGHTVELHDYTNGEAWSDFHKTVDSDDFDVYVFHTVLLAESIDVKAARYILDKTRARIIFFGPQPTKEPSSFLLDERCFVARGEAEFVIRDLIETFKTGADSLVKGVSCLKEGQMVEAETYGIIEDLDSLPIPARHLDELHGAFNPKLPDEPVTLALTSRGCSFKCYYCVPNAISWAREIEWKRFHDGKKPPVRLRSPESVAAEFEAIRDEGYRGVSIGDDMFLYGGKKRIIEICRRLEKVGLPFGMLARCDMILDEEVVEALAAAGCRYVDLGIESMDQAVLDDIKKGVKVEEIREAIALLCKHGIEPKANILLGASPLETRDTIDHTVKELSSSPLNYCMFSIATPFPGTEFYRIAKKEGWTVEPEINDLEKNLSPTDKALVSYPNLTKEDLEKAVKRANRGFYLAPKRLWFYLRRATSLSTLKSYIKTGWKVTR